MGSQPIFPKLIFHEGPNPGSEIELSQDEFFIGRDPLVDLVIPSPSVSRRHARIYRQDGRYRVQDLGSSNKTYVNEELLVSSRELKSGDIIQLGGAIHFTFLVPPPAGQEEAEQGISETLEEAAPSTQGQTMLEGKLPPATSTQPPQLLVTVAGGQSRTFNLGKSSISLGRSPDNDVVIGSPIVSGHHAVLERREQGYIFKILPNTTNPVW